MMTVRRWSCQADRQTGWRGTQQRLRGFSSREGIHTFTQLHSAGTVVILVVNPSSPTKPCNPSSPSRLLPLKRNPIHHQSHRPGDCPRHDRYTPPTPRAGVIVRHVCLCHPHRRLDISPASVSLLITQGKGRKQGKRRPAPESGHLATPAIYIVWSWSCARAALALLYENGRAIHGPRLRHHLALPHKVHPPAAVILPQQWPFMARHLRHKGRPSFASPCSPRGFA